MFQYKLSTLLVSAALYICCGCNSQPPASASNQQTLAVKGTVSLKGKPLAKGTISFEPDNGGREANGDIEDGRFSLTTFVKDDGAIAGLHRVAVRGAMGGKTDPVPLKYQNYSSSGITVEVKSDQAEYKIELK